MDAHFAVSFQIQNLRHPHPRKVPGSTQKWQEGIGVALTEVRALASQDKNGGKRWLEVRDYNKDEFREAWHRLVRISL